MVLIAGPELLGSLRKTLDAQVLASIERSINKDLSRCSSDELSDQLKAA
jgi:protein required for attachment to host cells